MATAPTTLDHESLLEPDGLYEVVDGRIQEKDMGAFEADIAKVLLLAINDYLRTNPLGSIHIELLFQIDPVANTRRRPDVAFLSAERWPLGKRPPRQAAWEVVPDLAIEVVSPGNQFCDEVRKIDDYFRAGVRLVWYVLPDNDRVYVYDSPFSVRILPDTEALDGGAVLPGFRLPLADLFGAGEST